jgi:hypothetical protein
MQSSKLYKQKLDKNLMKKEETVLPLMHTPFKTNGSEEVLSETETT